MSRAYRLPVKSKIMAALEKLRDSDAEIVDADYFLMNAADVLPYPHAIKILKALAPRYGYCYRRGKLYRIRGVGESVPCQSWEAEEA